MRRPERRGLFSSAGTAAERGDFETTCAILIVFAASAGAADLTARVDERRVGARRLDFPECIRSQQPAHGAGAAGSVMFDLMGVAYPLKPSYGEIGMADPEHICTIRQGVDIWNHWRARHPHIFPDLSGADLKGLNLKRADLRDTNLSGADLSNADLSEAELCHANLERVTLRKAELFRTDFFSAVLSGADMSEANLSYAILVEANLDCAKISGCQIYGLSAWNIREKPSEQANLVISCKDNPTITVNNIEMAQLIFVLYNNKKIRDLIDTVAEEVVLILGRFTEARKSILDAIRGRLAHLDYSPILFDFDRPVSRTLTETVSTLAHMARFIIADITEAKSIPQELMAIVPHLPNVPIQPILEKGHDEYGMFESFASYPWVLPVHRYESREELLKGFKVNVIEPVENWLKTRNSVATRRITPGQQ